MIGGGPPDYFAKGRRTERLRLDHMAELCCYDYSAGWLLESLGFCDATWFFLYFVACFSPSRLLLPKQRSRSFLSGICLRRWLENSQRSISLLL